MREHFERSIKAAVHRSIRLTASGAGHIISPLFGKMGIKWITRWSFWKVVALISRFG